MNLLTRSTIHNTRFVRFLLILSIVILTIFVYASYSTNPSLVPPHMRTAGSPLDSLSNSDGQSFRMEHNASSLKSVGSNANNSVQIMGKSGRDHGLSNDTDSSNALNTNIITKKLHHREPTIDVDALGASVDNADEVQDEAAFERLLSNDLLEEQYAQNVENTAGNINSSVIMELQQSQQSQQQIPKTKDDQAIIKQSQLSYNNFSKIADSDVLIPTSNLQKFIENADKILKNMTAPSSVSTKSTGKDNENETQPLDKKPIVSSAPNAKEKLVEDGDAPKPPSVVMAIRTIGDLQPENVKLSEKIDKKNVIAPVQKSQSTNSTKNPNHDTSKGIPTENIYENGHMDHEINIEKLCPNKGSDLKLLILITSAQAHADARLAIRQTWGHFGIRRDVSTAFVLGRTNNESLNVALSQENFIYGDLIRGHFIDSYNNLTLKTISALEWVDKHCNQAKFILKTDDDMFINVPKLLTFLDGHSKDKRTIYGRLAKKWKPIRNKKSKYYVSVEQFSAPVFPAFTTGPAYVLTNDIIHDLYVKSLRQVYLKLEDVFTTGIVAQQLGIKRVHANEFLNRRIAFNPCNIRKTISVHMIKSNEQFDLWKKLLDQTTKCK